MRNKTLQAIMAHAKQCYPQECCGVVAQKSRVERYFPCRNILPDNADEKRGPRYGFTIAPEDYANAEDWGTIAAIVHSHPDATTQPSEKDMAECDDSALPWHIVSWPEGDLRTIQPRGERPLVGRQFLLGHADCWGLIMSYFRQMHGIELKDFRVDYPWWEDGKKNFYMDNWFECGFREFTGDTQKGDMAIMQVSAPVANHAGILVEDGMLLHHLYGHLSNRTPYGGYWLERTLKIVRHKDLF